VTAYTVFYDSDCAFCVRCRHWLRAQRALVLLNFVPMKIGMKDERFKTLWKPGEELIVLGPAGEVYQGPNAFLVCLWALDAFREWSFRLSGPTLKPFARAAFGKISKNRHQFSEWLRNPDNDLAAELATQPREGCDDDHCRV